MTALTHFLSLCIFFSLLSFCAFDDEGPVFCDFKASCVLPCSFEPGREPEVKWERPGKSFISWYHHDKDYGAGHPHYKNRASVSKSEISRGNASLLLKEVRGQDDGLYWCLTSTSDSVRPKNTSIRVRVRAPVVITSLELTQTKLLCRSWDIYPSPDVTWTFSPERLDKPKTDISSSETGLFSVFSSVPLTLSSPHEYICNISTEHSWRSATYRRTAEIHFSGSVTVPCTEPTAPLRKLVWKFNSNYILIMRNRSELTSSMSWRPFVEKITDSNSLVLKNLTKDQLGLYSCELFTDTERFIIVTKVTGTKGDKELIMSIVVLLGITIVSVIVAFFLWRCLKVRREQPDPEEQVSNERAAPEPAPMSQETLQELIMSLTNFEDNDVGSYYSSGTASRPESYLFEESSGYGE